MTNYRISSTTDQDAFYELYLYAFNQTHSVRRRAFFDARFTHANNYGIHADNQLVSALYSLPFTVNFGGTEFSMAGIGDVCSAPEFSGRGGAGTLIKAALNDMYADGTTLSYLAPFAFSYYRRFGYEQVFNQIHYELSTTALPSFPRTTAGGHVTRSPLAAELPTVKKIYADNQSAAGGLVRADWWWHYLTLKHDWDVGIYQDAAGKPTGYVIYERTNSALTVKELVAPTSDEFTALRQFILKHGNSFAAITYDAPSLEYGGDLFPEPDAVTATIRPYMMARIVNLADFMAKYPGKMPAAPITLAVTDPVLTANQGTWQLSAAGFIKQDDDLSPDADITLDIQNLVKLLFGAQRPETLVRSGEITANSAAVSALTTLTAGKHPALIDYF
ncbi:GNAT family N-acetyltransferase [Lacticaseibacillus hulanensis]|uniref:GNAT family N-acetyltransferase n=1 Tax=Lacticaseibacillus hulanensis TaxID=2493111 RepID=UPI000FDACB8B|nr:GNAT family N-acetyltransferase [Lacticaseibacillus hulanensis]